MSDTTRSARGSPRPAPVRASAEGARLYVVATPIGNLGDITQRVVDVLKSVPVVACEDTRRTRVLLAHIGAAPGRVVALHDHNEAATSARMVDLLRAGQDVALVADAGTPLISDPGFELVRLAWEAGVAVTPVPGPSAVTTAIAASPIPVDRFRFEGFLPAKATLRRDALAALLASDVAVVFFEAPHRLRDTLTDLVEMGAGDRRLLVCRELTKLHESLALGTVADLVEAETILDRGEFVCILDRVPELPAAMSGQEVVDALAKELPPGQAARLAAKITGGSRRELYERAVSKRPARR